MKFEEVLPALREGKKIRLKGCEDFEYLFKPKNENYLKTEDYHNINLSWEDFFRDDWEIVREKKKVKLRDLSKRQYWNWKSEKCRNGCDNCVFNNVNCRTAYSSCWIYHKDLYSDKFLDQEIEVEEDE